MTHGSFLVLPRVISVGEAVEEVANGAPVLGDGLFPDRAQAANTGGDALVDKPSPGLLK